MDEVILMTCRYLYFYSLKTIVSKPYKYIFCANENVIKKSPAGYISLGNTTVREELINNTTRI